MIDFSAIYEKIGYTFRDENLLLRALTHSSYDRDASYERLEFLGDSIVGYAVSDILYFSSGKDEGTMTRTRASMVSKEPLAY
ncbi:MAG: ribonuclease III, partial [Clostridia bacterium]|nr:ribonuclease III [Clostridia bacterium]